MNISEMIIILSKLQESYGDLPILGGYLIDDKSPTSISPLNEDGCKDYENPIGVFIE
jgi:hypothetical protein